MYCFSFLFFSLSTVPGQTQMPKTLLDYQLIGAKADTILHQYVELGDFVGVSAGVFYQDTVLWMNGAGFKDLANKKSADYDMLHRIASITKPMTAIAVMQLVEQKLIDLDVPIQQYLPEYPRHEEGDITIRHLLNHTAGIGAYKSNKEAFPSKHYASLEDALGLFKNRKLEHQPGTAYLYTTYGYTVIGAILEKVTGQKYEDYMQQHIWGPAGMTHSSLEIAGQSYPNKASLYKRDKKGQFTPDKQTDLSVKYPGGGVLSTVPDLLRFGQAVLDNQLITAETLEMMRVPADVEWKSTPYGMGWFVVNDPVYGRIVRHGGRQSGTNTYLSIFLDQRFVVAVMANDYDSAAGVGGLHKDLYELVLDPAKREAPIRKVISVSPKTLQPYLGKYDFGKGRILTITQENGQLVTQMTGYPQIPIYPEAENKFFYRAFDSQLVFELNEKKELVKTTYIQNGASIFPTKIK